MNSLWAYLASIALIRTTIYSYLPERLRLYISSRFEEWTSRFTSEETMVFKDYQSSKMNQLFQAANLYLGESLPTISIPRVTVEKTESVRNLTFSIEKNTEMVDVIESVPMKWRADKIEESNRVVQLHTAAHDFWTPKPVIIQHPMTFETLAMNGNPKKELLEDLDRFMNSKEYYERIGNVEKRNLLLSMANRSILVMEDIDCSIKLQNRESGIKQPIKYHQQNKLLTEVKVSTAKVAGELVKTRDPKESSVSLPLASNGISMDNVKSSGPKPDVSAYKEKAKIELKLTENGPDSEADNNFDKKDLIQA
ncbi:P-loop containing nucleoside triphosphate hydrolases superfamily protein [Hibiscus syriacus]|uniref:P-loop containing nucleoside triphosphate hydrolases superfamily protein n=1 Tax=Hibiscus syriacus TaxID=106335 RepID=A0A6A2ZNN7_HIBSY|nr:P-loop containing nucleoside triphosphate hydrolases superfamily protein [Hibiscus syriacus]